MTARIVSFFAGLPLLMTTGCAKPTEPRPQEPVAVAPSRADATRCPENDEGIRSCPCESNSGLYPSCDEAFIEACGEFGANAFACTATCDDGTCCEGTCTPPP